MEVTYFGENWMPFVSNCTADERSTRRCGIPFQSLLVFFRSCWTSILSILLSPRGHQLFHPDFLLLRWGPSGHEARKQGKKVRWRMEEELPVLSGRRGRQVGQRRLTSCGLYLIQVMTKGTVKYLNWVYFNAFRRNNWVYPSSCFRKAAR